MIPCLEADSSEREVSPAAGMEIFYYGEKTYTLNQYRDMVKKSLLKTCAKSEKETAIAKKYFDSEEAQDVIRDSYKTDI